MVAHINRLFAIPPAKLSDVRDCRIIERPKGVFIERFDAFLKTYLNAIREQIVLAKEILLLNSVVQIGVVFFADRHVREQKLGPPFARRASFDGSYDLSRMC
jgi:hypothetical protein